MNLFKQLVEHFSKQGKALSLYRRGMAKAKIRDHQGAIDDYSAAIDISNAPAQMKAMVLYNRALVYSAAGQDSKAIEDLDVVLVMKEALTNVKIEARRMLLRMQNRSNEGCS